MTGRGKGGKGLGKGAAKRHRRAPSLGAWIGKPAIRRLARRGGVKRLSALCYAEINAIAKQFLNGIVRHSIVFADHANRKTIVSSDVLYAIKYSGKKLIGH
ncbi:Histone H4 [Astathelohania contejeani]|uniref:Histone H4 n=1 Tax=Astathelohania contejeani TaxID=164912 RepID=A0ABQ7HZ52_9MICR|nr:Histone H4 [Thelohania contejeani]